MKTKPVAWSFSVLSTFENCPKQYLEVNLKKSVKKENYAASEGARKHKEIELYLLNGVESPTVEKYRRVIDHFRQMPGHLYTEHQMAIDTSHQPVDFKDWNNAWCRAASDVLVVNGDTATVVDWKFGKPRDGDDQLKLNAGIVFDHFPKVNNVEGVYVYLEHKHASPTYKYNRQEYADIWQGFTTRYSAILKAIEETNWPARPSGLCSYCPVTSCTYHRGSK